MNPSEPIPPLRMADPETPEALAARVEREKRAAATAREAEMENSLLPFHVGSVPYLNAVPLTRGIEDQVVFAPPAQLGEMLRRGALDAALISVTEVLLRDDYDVLDGIAVASLGEVKSVFLAHRRPIAEAREVFLDPASLASVHLLKVLLAERRVAPAYRTMEPDADPLPDFFLLIGDRAIEFLRSDREHQIWDLGAAWYELTSRPFVYAVWALRRVAGVERLRRQLREARDFGLETLDSIIGDRDEFDYQFRRDYLGWHIHYHLGADEKEGLRIFCNLLVKHGLGPVFEPRFVS